jgi:class 3 adenylate cyclase
MPPQPSATVTLLFGDIEGSTRLLQSLAPAARRQFWHRALLRAAFDGHEGPPSPSPPMLVKVIARS